MSESTEQAPDSAGEDENEGGLPAPVEALRTVTPSYRGRPDRGMDVFGWGMFLALVLLLVPLLPIIAVVWAISKLLDVVVGE